MCGICGSVSPRDATADVRLMLPRLVHRGPDDEGLWSMHNVALGHRRLSIVDLSSAGHQPMIDADGQLAAVVNGEIYNYPELRSELEHIGAVFRSNSDSEIVLHTYKTYGSAGFAKFNGMFAFALYDVAQRRLLLVRDRIGIKPVYYWHDPSVGRFLFASEIKAILAAAGRARWPIDPEGLGHYLSFENMLGDRTLFSGIHCLPPASRLELDAGGLRVETYWRPSIGNGAITFPDAVEHFSDKFGAAVGRHLMGDVPIASYMSSGFDSTLVASEAARKSANPPHAYTGTFAEGGWYDETSSARLVASHIGAPMTEVVIGADDFAAELDNVVRALDEPRMGTGAFSQYMVAKSAAQSFKVILTGHGGDELFSGYPVFKNAALADARNLHKLFTAAASIKPAEVPHLAYFIARRFTPGGAPGELPLLFSSRQIGVALQNQARAAVFGTNSYSPIENISDSAQSAYERVLLTYLKVYLPGLLVVEDKISMAHSLESRTPFLDNEILDLSLSLSPDVKLTGGALKAIIKAKARDQLPAALFSLPKRGFPTPLSRWLRGTLADWLRQRLTGPDSRLNKIFLPEFVASEVEHYIGSWRRGIRPLDEIQTHRMWMLLCLESWLRQTEDLYGVELVL